MCHQDRSGCPEEGVGGAQIGKSFDRVEFFQAYGAYFVLERQLPSVQLQYLRATTSYN